MKKKKNNKKSKISFEPDTSPSAPTKVDLAIDVSTESDMAEGSQKQLLATLQGLFHSGQYSDLTITCGHDSYSAHKAIVCSRSSFFAKAMQFPGKESEKTIVDLPEDEPETIKLLLQYLYEGEYEPFLVNPPKLSSNTISNKQTTAHSCNETYYCQDYGSEYVCDHHRCGSQCSYNCADFKCAVCMPEPIKLNGTEDQLLTHSKMYEIGERFIVQGLKQLAKEKFRVACDEFWRTSAFPQAAHHAFSSTITEDNGLRSIVCKSISNHMELVKSEAIAALMMEFNGLAYGLLREKVDQGWK